MKKDEFQVIYNNVLFAELEELKLYRPLGIGECCKHPNAMGCYQDKDGWWNVYETDDWQHVIVRARLEEESAFDMLYEEIIGTIHKERERRNNRKNKEAM